MRPLRMISRARRVRDSVIARLLLTLVLALGAVATFQYFYVGGSVERNLIREHAMVHEADARSLERRAEETASYEDPRNEMTQLLQSIAARPETTDVAVVDNEGIVIAAAEAGRVGTAHADPRAAQAARSGRRFAGADAVDGGGHAYVTPAAVSGRRVGFIVEQTSAALSDDVAAFHDSLLLFVVLSLLCALPLFYLLGGRSVAALYRTALRRARRDGLTDLDNHRAFQDELSRAVSETARYGTPLTLALIDIDDFKFENDRHGHQHGDRLLCELAEMLRDSRTGDRAFRLGGDEFALLLAHTNEGEADVPLERIRQDAERSLAGVTVSIGFSAAGSEDREATSLWGRADAALLEAKRRGGNTVVAATEVADSVSVVTIEKVRAVRALIEGGEVNIAFQPIWDLGGTRLLGYEAFARPSSPELAGPGEAFEIADSIGRGHELDAICRRAALRATAELPDDVLLFLNVSPQTLEHDGVAGDSLVQAVRGAGFEPGRVVLEITERTDARKEAIVPEATRLRALGFKLALDDVGAGNAGLEMLRALPVDFIKIDRAVVSNAVADSAARAVMLGIMAFARESGAFVIAEGIETEEMLELARDPQPGAKAQPVGAQGAQGYLLGRPAPASSGTPTYAQTLAALTELTADRERRRISEALRRSEHLYNVLVTSVPGMTVALLDRELRCHLVDGDPELLADWRPILEGRTVREAVGPEQAPYLEAFLRPALDGEPQQFEYTGSISGSHYHVNVVPIEDPRVGVIGLMAICRDVTERHEVDAALRSSRDRRPVSAPARTR